MSATGQGGVTVIAGRNHSTLNPVAIPSGYKLVFEHNVGRRAFSVIVTSGAPNSFGQVLTSADNVFVTQPTVNVIEVIYSFGEVAELVFISCRWEEPTPELDLVQYQEQGQGNDPRISIVQLPEDTLPPGNNG